MLLCSPNRACMGCSGRGTLVHGKGLQRTEFTDSGVPNRAHTRCLEAAPQNYNPLVFLPSILGSQLIGIITRHQFAVCGLP